MRRAGLPEERNLGRRDADVGQCRVRLDGHVSNVLSAVNPGAVPVPVSCEWRTARSGHSYAQHSRHGRQRQDPTWVGWLNEGRFDRKQVPAVVPRRAPRHKQPDEASHRERPHAQRLGQRSQMLDRRHPQMHSSARTARAERQIWRVKCRLGV